ncbi:MAG TPA: DUF4430 domain-containing protein [Clostridiaceae bacterium]|nr:DUF4430 domain-containing protein [Clostridiaceae bacterium]
MSGLFIVAHLKGWFDRETPVVLNKKSGLVNIERKGIAYSVASNTAIRAGDQFKTKAGAKAEFLIGDTSILKLGANSIIEFVSIDSQTIVELKKGELLLQQPRPNANTSVKLGAVEIKQQTGSLLVNAYESTKTVMALSGTVAIADDKLTHSLNSGEVAFLLDTQGHQYEIEIRELEAETLSNDQLQQLLVLSDDSSTCLTKEEIQEVVSKRTQEVDLARKVSPTNNVKFSSETGESLTPAQEGVIGAYCTLEIRCDSILDNKEKLKPEKEKYVPDDGIVLSSQKLRLEPSETAFDVLKKACSTAGIQLEYSWTPIYNSYYVEGINHLYEFDCGFESGWTYKVNGWFPNYGSSVKALQNGDVVVWVYTCDGIGGDSDD